LTNCRIKAVFGGLPVQSAKLMAEEMFIGKLDPKKIKVAIYQTKFWPQYKRDKVYTKGTVDASTWNSGDTSALGSTTGGGTGAFYQSNDWFGSELTGTATHSNYQDSRMSATTNTAGGAHSDVDMVADIPILLPVPFQELSSLQFYTPEEQLLELTAALKNQFD